MNAPRRRRYGLLDLAAGIGVLLILAGVNMALTCIEFAYFKPKRVRCNTVLRTLTGAYGWRLDDQRDAQPLQADDWFETLRPWVVEDHFCPGLGVGESPYLFLAEGQTDSSLPLFAERIGNHIERTSGRWWVLDVIEGSNGAHVAYAGGGVEWLAPDDLRALVESIGNRGMRFRAMDGSISSPLDADPTAPTWALRLNPDRMWQVFVATGVLLISLRIALPRLLGRRSEPSAALGRTLVEGDGARKGRK
jgi:hypothetical protein